MNSRHRFSANEYRSSNTSASKMSPEMLTRSQSLHRSDNSGNYRRFRPRNFPPRRSDVFIEAGRLAVDYLVSHGLLPSDVLSVSSSNNNNSTKKSNIPELRDPTPPGFRGKSEQDIVDDVKASGRQRRKSPTRCSSPRGNVADEDGKDDSFMISKADNNEPLDISNLSNEQLQRNSEDVGTSGVINQESAQLGKDADATEEKHTDSSASNTCKEDGINKTASINVSDGATDTANMKLKLSDGATDTANMKVSDVVPDTTCSELTVPVLHNVLNDGSSAGSPFESHNPGGDDRGGKRPSGDDDARDNTKKAKQWLSVSYFHENLQHMDSISDKSIEVGQERRPAPPGRLGIEAVNQDQCFATVSMLPKDGATSTGPSMPYSEKQFFPSSFKICDLNLMEVSDNTNESHDAPTVPYSPISVPGKQVPVDVDLSMGSNSGVNNEYNKYKASDKAIDVIDLEGDSLHEDRNFQTSIRRSDSGFTGLDNFPNHVQTSSYNPDTQDGYGLMISEMIGNDIPNCPPVQPETNTLHSDILHPGENILSDDDQIYMTLGDIPITGLLRGWDQPNQDY